VLIRNLPCIDRENEMADANAVASDLASLAEVESPVAVIVRPEDRPPNWPGGN
jgi:hypothetical protein